MSNWLSKKLRGYELSQKKDATPNETQKDSSKKDDTIIAPPFEITLDSIKRSPLGDDEEVVEIELNLKNTLNGYVEYDPYMDWYERKGDTLEHYSDFIEDESCTVLPGGTVKQYFRIHTVAGCKEYNVYYCFSYGEDFHQINLLGFKQEVEEK